MDRGLEVIAGGEVRTISGAEMLECADGGVVHLGAFLGVPAGSWVTVAAADDGYVASIPSDSFTPGAHYDVSTSRLTVREGSTLCWNVKGVTSIRIGSEKLPDSVPENPPH